MNTTMRTRDKVLGAVGVLVAAGLGLEANKLGYPSKVFPLLVSFAILTLSALIGIRAIVQQSGPSGTDGRFLPSFRSFVVIGVVLAYVVSIELIGFYVSSFVCVVVISLVTEKDKTSLYSVIRTTIATSIFLLFVYLIFSYGFKSTISSGVLF